MSNKGMKKTREKLMQKADSFIKEHGLKDGLSDKESKEFDRLGESWWVIFQAVCIEAGIVEARE